mgnify:CR=1 FL=1
MKTREKRTSFIDEGDIDMTPLIDCIFLLLIFFMVTTVFLDLKGLVVDLPGASDQQQNEDQKQKKDVNIQVTANGEYTVNGEIVSASALASAIRGAMDEANNRNVIIQGDPETENKYIVYAMDMAQGQGAEQMAFAVEQQESE